MLYVVLRSAKRTGPPLEDVVRLHERVCRSDVNLAIIVRAAFSCPNLVKIVQGTVAGNRKGAGESLISD